MLCGIQLFGDGRARQKQDLHAPTKDTTSVPA